VKPRSSIQITCAVIFALVLREIQALAGRRRLGAFWALAEPLVHLVMFTVVMGVLRGRPDIAGHPYAMFLLVGMAPYLMYRRIAMMMAEGVGSSRALFAYKQITPMDTFLARILVEVCITSVVYVLIVLGFIWFGFDMTVPHPLEWVGVLLLGLLFTFSLGLILAALVNALPDSRTLIRMAFMPIYLISGIIVPPSHLPPEFLPYLMWNPFLHLAELTHEATLSNYESISGISAGYVARVTLIMLFFGLGLYRVFRKKYIAIVS